MSAIAIRAASALDADAVARLEQEAFGPASWGASSVIDGLNRTDTKTAIACRADSGATVGFAMWRVIAEEAELLTIGVANDYRRRGVAQALIREIVAECESLAIERLFLEVDRENAAAVGLYRSCGFERIGLRRRYYKSGADALVMRLTLR